MWNEWLLLINKSGLLDSDLFADICFSSIYFYIYQTPIVFSSILISPEIYVYAWDPTPRGDGGERRGQEGWEENGDGRVSSKILAIKYPRHQNAG